MLFSTTKGVSYELNFNRIIFDVLPLKLKKLRIFQYLLSAFQPLKELSSKFIAYRKDTIYIMNVNGNTMVFERYLRDRYGSESINIVNVASEFQQTYLYRYNERGDITNTKNYLYNKNEIVLTSDQLYVGTKQESSSAYDFKVQIPQELILAGVSTIEVLEIANEYKPIGTVGIIEII